MNGKERVLRALSREPVDRTPWVPYCGVQTANLLGIDAETYLKDTDNIVEGILKAYETYQPDGLPVVFDIQIEAEALGCRLQWSKSNPPAVMTHILEEKSLSDLAIPSREDGRYPIILEAAGRLVTEIGDDVALYSLICGPLTLALHLRGTDFFTEMIEEPEIAHEILAFCTEVGKSLSGMYAETGVPIVAVVDPMVSQISPRHFQKFVFSYLEEINTHIKSLGLKATTFCCGDATKNLDLMCQTNTDGIAFDENIDLNFAKEVASKNKVAYGGNLPLTTVMLFGSPLENVEEAKRQIEIGSGLGYILSPGCDMPFDTPPNNIIAISKLVNGDFASIETLTAETWDGYEEEEEDETEDGKIRTGEVFIEIVTLDSEGCPPCQYMCEAVRRIESRYEGHLIWRETLIKTKAGIKRMGKLGVKNLPALLINNEVVFDNIIPTEKELINEIEKRIG